MFDHIEGFLAGWEATCVNELLWIIEFKEMKVHMNLKINKWNKTYFGLPGIVL